MNEYDKHKIWDARAGRYDHHYDQADIRLHTCEEIGRLINSDPLTLVDLGSGTGRLTEHLLTKYKHTQYHLVDSSALMLKKAMLRFCGENNVEYHCADFRVIPLEDSSIDFVVSAYALHHVTDEDKIKVIKEIHRILKPSGTAIIADEIIVDNNLEPNSERLFQRMLETFYPNCDPVTEATLRKIDEWPSSLNFITTAFESTGFLVEATPLSDITALIYSKKEKLS